MQEPIARWNPSRECWETEQLNLLSGQPDVWSGTWPQLGIAAHGVLYELPTRAPPHQRARFFLIGYPDGQPWDMRRAAKPRQTTGGRPQREPTGPGLGPLMPTPQATYAPRSSPGYGPNLHEAATALTTTYGPYAPAIARWEQATGRAAPPPTTPPRRAGGNPQLSARFVEWLMGLPDGHVTGPDLNLSREHQLRLLGNGVVPQQAALAVSALIHTAKDVEHAQF